MNRHEWKVAQINGRKVKYCYADRHYFLWLETQDKWERMSLRAIAIIVNAPATLVAHNVKHGKTYTAWEEYRARKTSQVPAWENLLLSIKNTRHTLDTVVSRFTKVAIKARLVFLISKAWFMGRSLGYSDATITGHLARVNP